MFQFFLITDININIYKSSKLKIPKQETKALKSVVPMFGPIFEKLSLEEMSKCLKLASATKISKEAIQMLYLECK